MKIITTTTPTVAAQARRLHQRLHIRGTSTKTTPTTTHPRRRTPVRAFLTPRSTRANSHCLSTPAFLTPRYAPQPIDTNRISHHHKHHTWCLLYYLTHLPSNTQGQTRRLLPHWKQSRANSRHDGNSNWDSMTRRARKHWKTQQAKHKKLLHK